MDFCQVFLVSRGFMWEVDKVLILIEDKKWILSCGENIECW